MSRCTRPSEWACPSADSPSRSSRSVRSTRQRPVALDELRQVGSFDDLHRVPQQAGAAADVVDVHDVGVVEPGSELRFAPESFNGLGILGQFRVQHLEGHLALEVQVAHAVDQAEPAAAQQRQQFVVVAQGPPEPRFPERAFRRFRRQRAKIHRYRLEGTGGVGKILPHLRRGHEAAPRLRLECAHDDALQCGRDDRPQCARAGQFRGVGRGRRSRDGEVEDRASGVDVTRRIARLSRAHLRRKKRQAGQHLARRLFGERQIAVAQVGDRAPAAGVEQQRRGHDAPHDDAVGVGVFQRAQQIARQLMHVGNRSRTTLDGFGQALAFDPVPDPIAPDRRGRPPRRRGAWPGDQAAPAPRPP